MTVGLMRFNRTVLQVIPALQSGGAERTTLEIARAIIAAGGRALVATSGGRLAEDIEALGGKVFPMPVHSKNPLAMIANRGRLLRLIGEERVDLLHVRSRAPAWPALWAARKARIPLVATYHGVHRAGNPVKRFYNSAMARADIVIANSEFTAAAIRGSYRIDDSRLRVIPRGADLAVFDPAAVAPERVEVLARRWGLTPAPGGALRLLLPGRLTALKGHDVVVEAAHLLKQGRGSGQPALLQLVFAGDERAPGDSAALAHLIDKRGVRDMIHLVGHCADMAGAYAWSDAALAPSIWPEAFGRVAVEAGAMGKPTVASDHGGARATIVDGETGLLTKPGDSAALARAIETLAEMGPAGRAAMGARAYARVRRLYSIEAMQNATLDAYEAAMKRGA
ncbi:MAG: glycosyltransferase family 4 protein [Amphiplicatus sp.]